MHRDPPADLDEARRAVGAGPMFAEASGHLTGEVAVHLEFHELVAYKKALKKFFSAAPWTDEDADRLSKLVAPHLADDAWWDHGLEDGVRLSHGMTAGTYVLWVSGGAAAEPSIFDRVFSGPVIPEATPHPGKVKFNIGGTTAPGVWYRPGDDIDDHRVDLLLAEPDVTDVMVAGDFVTVGLRRSSSWEDRLDALLDLVTTLFWDEERAAQAPPERTRDELVSEGRSLPAQARRPEELHLLDPDDPDQRIVLEEALDDEDSRIRRMAVATLAQAVHAPIAWAGVITGYRDPSRLVRRTAIDAAADREEEDLRPLFEEALTDADPWTRWKAVRSLAELGVGASREAIAALAADDDFQVRMEVAAALRAAG